MPAEAAKALRGSGIHRVVAATLGGVVAVGSSLTALWIGAAPPASAATSAGPAEIVRPGGGRLTSGDSKTEFLIRLPAGAACKGDSARGNYRIQSYLVPVSAKLETLAFAPGVGPAPVDGEFRAPMYGATFSADSFVDQLTAEAVPIGGPGSIIQPLPAFSFAVFDPAFGFPFTPGVYNVGIACTIGPPSPTQQEKHWNTVLTVRADPNDSGPAKIGWTVTTSGPPSSGTTSTVPWFAIFMAGAVTIVGGLALRSRKGHNRSRPDASLSHSGEQST